MPSLSKVTSVEEFTRLLELQLDKIQVIEQTMIGYSAEVVETRRADFFESMIQYSQNYYNKVYNEARSMFKQIETEHHLTSSYNISLGEFTSNNFTLDDDKTLLQNLHTVLVEKENVEEVSNCCFVLN